MGAEEPTGRIFGYGISRASWGMLGLLALGVALLTAEALIIEGPRTLSDEGITGLGIIALVLGVVLLPVPLLDIGWWLRGRVVVADDGLHWRAWGAWRSIPWAEIVAIGQPPGGPSRSDDTRLHVLTTEGYEFIHGYLLRERAEAVELITSWASLPEREQVGRYLFRCRAGTSERVAARAAEHVDTGQGGHDPWDFWAMRARRF